VSGGGLDDMLRCLSPGGMPPLSQDDVSFISALAFPGEPLSQGREAPDGET
jgi:hypothetical protein